ncbi:MAG: hypothetical protein E3J21_08615 [Anaerolineales bacterium]|nr:MAG: hypothetical protein E3J21_08615 [Anaerolineales bacterium]
MPRNKRGDIKLKHDQTITHLETALRYQTELYNLFLEPHPDYAEGYGNICMMLVQVLEFVKKMKGFI